MNVTQRHVDRLAALAILAATLWLRLPLASAQVSIASQSRITVADTQRFVLHSQQMNRDYIVDVSAPRRIPPNTGVPSQLVAQHVIAGKVPVIYALDGGLEVTSSAVRLLGFNFAMQPAYVVAIDNIEPWGPSQWAARTRDLLHSPITRDGRQFGGEGAKFATFLLEELRPFIESHFAADPQRSVLVGHSQGGLFAATVLIEHPDAFYGYLIASPSLAEDSGLLDRAKTASMKAKGQRVFIGVGSLEGARMRSDTERLAHELSRPGSGLLVRQDVAFNQDHVPSYLALLPMALEFLLPTQ